MSKYVFCDLDFTLLDNDRKISEENFKAIKKFESKGNHFIICSGRVPFALEKFKNDLSSSDLITSNGAWIYSNNQLIKRVTLDKNIIKIITKYAITNNLNIRYFTFNTLYLLNQKYASKTCYLYDQFIEFDEKEIFNELDKLDIIKFVLTSDDREKLENAYKDIEEMHLKAEVVFSSDVFLEVNAFGQNKGNAIIDYCKFNNINMKDTISIGDNENDISMLEITKFSACPINAIDEVKNVVDYICKNDNDHNAVKEVLEYIEQNG